MILFLRKTFSEKKVSNEQKKIKVTDNKFHEAEAYI